MTSTIALIERAKVAARLFYANAEGCSVNHYGADFATHGAPGWMTDAKADIDAAMAELTTLQSQLAIMRDERDEARLQWSDIQTQLTTLLERCEKAEAERDGLKAEEIEWRSVFKSNYARANDAESKLAESELQRDQALKANAALTKSVRKLGLEELVHGWHASGAYDRHPDELGCTLPTNCGTVYAIVSALPASAAIGGKQEPVDSGDNSHG